MGADTEQVTNYLSKLIGEMPKVTGSGREANKKFVSFIHTIKIDKFYKIPVIILHFI